MPKKKKTNKLAMVGKKKPRKTKKKSVKKLKGVIDVPIAKELSQGSKASLGSIDYHYQKYYNTFGFLKEILNKNATLNKNVCIPDVGKDWMQSFLKVNFMKNIGELKPHLESVKPVDQEASKNTLMKELAKVNIIYEESSYSGKIITDTVVFCSFSSKNHEKIFFISILDSIKS